MMRISTFVLPLLLAISLAACKRHPIDQQTSAPLPAPVATPAPVPTPAPPPTPATPGTQVATTFDLQSVPVVTRDIPAFPYMDTPAGLKANETVIEKDLDFDKVYVIAGNDFHPVEGKVLHREFSLLPLKWSPLAAHRNYETVLKELGATRVDKLHPGNEQFVERNGGNSSAIFQKMNTPFLDRGEDPEAPGYEQWLLRTPKRNIWLSFFVQNGEVHLLTIEEKAMEQSVKPMSAAAP